MEPPTKATLYLGAGAITVALITLAACGTVRPSSDSALSKPPAQTVVLAAPATVTENGNLITFPAGEYHLADTDRGVYYFKAPQKITVDEVAVFAYDGGLYVSRGSIEPTRWYVIRNGKMTGGRFKKVPAHKLVQ